MGLHPRVCSCQPVGGGPLFWRPVSGPRLPAEEVPSTATQWEEGCEPGFRALRGSRVHLGPWESSLWPRGPAMQLDTLRPEAAGVLLFHGSQRPWARGRRTLGCCLKYSHGDPMSGLQQAVILPVPPKFPAQTWPKARAEGQGGARQEDSAGPLPSLLGVWEGRGRCVLPKVSRPLLSAPDRQLPPAPPRPGRGHGEGGGGAHTGWRHARCTLGQGAVLIKSRYGLRVAPVDRERPCPLPFALCPLLRWDQGQEVQLIR